MEDYRGFLKLLHKSTPAYRKTLLEGAPHKLIVLLANCALNILQGQVLLTNHQKTKLRPHHGNLRKLADKKLSPANKKKILQKGGFLPLLIPLLGPLLGAITGVVANKVF